MTDWEGLTGLVDVLFNGRKSRTEPRGESSKKPQITVRDLVQRGTSIVRCDGKMYSIVVTEVKSQR